MVIHRRRRISVLLPVELVEQLKTESKRRGCKVSQLIEEAIRMLLEKEAQLPGLAHRRQGGLGRF